MLHTAKFLKVKIKSACCKGCKTSRNTYSGWDKGNIENKVGYERRNMFVSVPTILAFAAFNENLFTCCEKDMKRLYYHKKQQFKELFAADKEAMLPLNPIEFKICKLQSAKADKYGKVMF